MVQTTLISNNPWLECRVSDLYHSHTALETCGTRWGLLEGFSRGVDTRGVVPGW